MEESGGDVGMGLGINRRYPRRVRVVDTEEAVFNLIQTPLLYSLVMLLDSSISPSPLDKSDSILFREISRRTKGIYWTTRNAQRICLTVVERVARVHVNNKIARDWKDWWLAK